MESVRTAVKKPKPNGIEKNANADKKMFKRPIIIYRPRSRRGSVSTNLPIKAVVIA
jgi:hypothetical protein